MWFHSAAVYIRLFSHWLFTPARNLDLGVGGGGFVGWAGFDELSRQEAGRSELELLQVQVCIPGPLSRMMFAWKDCPVSRVCAQQQLRKVQCPQPLASVNISFLLLANLLHRVSHELTPLSMNPQF